MLSVSRQIIVGDVALLRAAGTEIVATARGYIMERNGERRRTVACCHPAEAMGRELELMVDFGCAVEDVTVEHPVYGQLTGSLQIANRYDVSQFINRCSTFAAHPLSKLTEGIHLHTLLCPDEAAYLRVKDALGQLGMLLEDAGD